MVEAAHAATGLPWWATFACGAFVVRGMLFPVTLRQARAGALLGTAIARARGPNGERPTSVSAILGAAMELRRRSNGTHPAWLVAAPAVQLPVFVTVVLAVRKLATTPGIGMDAGGAAWFVDLTRAAVELETASAPMGIAGGILPGLTAAALFVNINNAFGKIAETSGPAGIVKLAMEWLTVPALMIGMQLPQAVHCYWFPASLSALIQASIMRTPEARKALNVDPKVPSWAGQVPSHVSLPPVAPPASSEATAAAVTSGAVTSVGVGEDGTPPAAAVMWSRPLADEEARLVREAAEARAKKDPEEAARLLEEAAALGPAPAGGSPLTRTEVDRGGREGFLHRFHADAHPTVLFALGQTYAALKRWKRSAAAYEMCASVEANPELRARALSGAGVARGNAGDLKAAVRALEEAIELRDGDVTSMITLAAVHKQSGGTNAALEVLKRAEKIAPEVRERFIEPLELELAQGRGKGGKFGMKGRGRRNGGEGGGAGGDETLDAARKAA